MTKMKWNILFVALSVAVAATGNSLQSVSIDQVSDLLAREQVQAKLNSHEQKYMNVMEDNMFYRVDRALLSEFAGEELGDDDFVENELKEPWNVEVGRSLNWQYMINDATESVQLVNVGKMFSEGMKTAHVGEEAIVQRAKNDLLKLGLSIDRDDTLEMHVGGLGRAHHDENGKLINELIAHKVRVYRRIGTARIENAIILLSYFMDGSLQKVSMEWPYMAGQSMMLDVDDATMTRVEEKAYVGLSSHPFAAFMDVLRVDVGWLIEDSQLKRTLLFWKPVVNPESLQQTLVVPL